MDTSGYITAVKKYAIHDGPGIRTTIFLRGCPLSCWWCHNPECQISPSELRNRNFPKTTVTEVMREIEKDRVFHEQSEGGVTFSGGEPLVQLEFLKALLEACQKAGIHTAVDTCGYAEYQHFDSIRQLIDLFLYDLKIFDEAEHIAFTGVSNQLIQDNLKRLSEEGHRIRIRIPLIPSITDTELNLSQLARFITSTTSVRTIDLLPFNRLGVSKYRRMKRNSKLEGLQTQSQDEILAKQDLLSACGLEVDIGGGS